MCVYVAHRSQTYPHATRKPILSSMKRKDSKDSTRTQSIETSAATTTSASSTATGTPISSPQKSVPNVIVSDEEAVISERAAGGPHSDSDTDERRVQFNKKKEIKDATASAEEADTYIDNHDETKKKIRG